jgi:hypothetical protein
MGLVTAAAAVVGTTLAGKAAADAQAKGARRAADAQVQAADQATALEREIYYDQRALLEPSITAGANARARQMLMQGYSPEEVRAYLQQTGAAVAGGGQGGDLQSRYPAQYARYQDADGDGRPGGTNQRLYGSFENFLRATEGADALTSIEPDTSSYDWVDDWSWESSSPSYGFRFDEGQRALERSAAARGDLFSGGTGRELTRYGQNFASQEFENDWRRLGELAGDGEQATGTVVNVAGNYGDSAASNTLRAGDARASGYRGEADANARFWGETIPGAIGATYGMGRKGGWFS